MAIVQVIGLAKLSHRKSNCKGVETIEQGIMLLEMGCDLAQGLWYFKTYPSKRFYKLGI